MKMTCYECGGTYTENTDRLDTVDPFVGPIFVEGVMYHKCSKCGDILYPLEMCKALDEVTDKRMRELLGQHPLSDFMTAAETSTELGISPQALSKHRRIRHGFIYHTKFGGATVYLRPSVAQFKETGDGRFPLFTEKRGAPVKRRQLQTA